MLIDNPYCNNNACKSSKLFYVYSEVPTFHTDHYPSSKQNKFEVTFSIDPEIRNTNRVVCVEFDENGKK